MESNSGLEYLLFFSLMFLYMLLQKPIGIIALLDEACMFPKSTHGTFSTKLFQNFRAHPRLEKAKFSETDFTISHYAGKVTYQTDTFLDKNRDYVVVEHCNLLSSSKCSFIAGLFPSLPEESSRSSYKFSSVASRFKVPHVTRTDYQLIDISEDGFVSLLSENGNTKDDLKLPPMKVCSASVRSDG